MGKANPDEMGTQVRYRGTKRKRYEQLVELRSKLFDLYTDLYGDNTHTDHNAGEDSADIGSDNFMRQVNLDVMGQEGLKLMLIEDALKRLENGKYGKCLDCSVAINEARLDALPFAKLCISCKSQREEEGSDYIAKNAAEALFDENEITE